jgi:alkylation response protein AidB-like acyl-CoA dehydrogenase
MCLSDIRSCCFSGTLLMNFDFSDDQKSLKDQARKLLSRSCSTAHVRKVLDDDGIAFDADLWREIASLGWLGVSIPEAYDGLGLGRLELCVLAEEMGRALAPTPFASTLYFFAEALLLAGSEAQKRRMLPGVASGQIIGAYAVAEGPGPLSPDHISCVFENGLLTGVKIPVADGDIATHAIVLAKDGSGLSLVLVDLTSADVVRTPVKTLDPTRSHARLEFRNAAAERIGAAGEGWDLSEAVSDRAAVLLAFEQTGGAQACLDMAVEYARNRYAFSRQIGSFQAIKHKLADMYVGIEIARSHAYYGAWALSTDAPELAVAAASARIAATEAYNFAAKENIQVHGGMGFTWAVDCHLFYRRAKLLGVQAGGLALWKEKLVSRLERRNAA